MSDKKQDENTNRRLHHHSTRDHDGNPSTVHNNPPRDRPVHANKTPDEGVAKESPRLGECEHFFELDSDDLMSSDLETTALMSARKISVNLFRCIKCGIYQL